jgi:hypothetical protein
MRKLRAALIVRDGNACAYCRVPFTDPGAVTTVDHIAPYCLYRTWRREALVLACHACNQAKADRLPMLLALLILHRQGHPAPDASPDADADRRPVFTPDLWALLARIAGAVESGARPDATARQSPDASGDVAGADRCEHRAQSAPPADPPATAYARLAPRPRTALEAA